MEYGDTGIFARFATPGRRGISPTRFKAHEFASALFQYLYHLHTAKAPETREEKLRSGATWLKLVRAFL